MEKSESFKMRLGLFVVGGVILFLTAIFYIGRQQQLFNPVVPIHSHMHNVSGLQIGNNVRFSGINVGTVDNIRILNDTFVRVDMLIDKDVQKFIKTDCLVIIGSEGIIGDRVVNITQAGNSGSEIKPHTRLESIEPIETDAIIAGLQVTVENAEIVSGQLAEMLLNLNEGQGAIGRLLKDTTIASNLDATMENLKKSSEGLHENMEAAKSNFLLRRYFKNKEKEKERTQEVKSKGKK